MKTQSSMLFDKKINLRIEAKPKFMKLGVGFSLEERHFLINILKNYHGIVTYTYNDLNTYDTRIIQHAIPMK